MKQRDLAAMMALTLAVLLLEASPAVAGSFRLIEGGRYELCREYAKNLAAFPDLSDKTYEWPLDPKLTDFTKPHWKAVDVKQHMDVIKTLYIWNYPRPSNVDPETTWQSKSSEALADIERGAVRLELTEVDFNHIGSNDTLYRYYHDLPDRDAHALGTQGRGYWYIYVSDRYPQLAADFRTDSFFDRFYDSFFFKSRFYLIDLGTFGRDMATTLTVYEPRANLNTMGTYLLPVCRFRYGD